MWSLPRILETADRPTLSVGSIRQLARLGTLVRWPGVMFAAVVGLIQRPSAPVYLALLLIWVAAYNGWAMVTIPRAEDASILRLGRALTLLDTVSFFALLAALLTRIGLYAGFFGGFGGGRNSNNNNNAVPVWLIVTLVSIVVYAISFVLIRTISRYREYAADRGSAVITGAPEHLMSALQKIASGITQIPERDLREVAGMNAFFIVPTNWRSATAELFATHPPLEKRLAALAEIARSMGKAV